MTETRVTSAERILAHLENVKRAGTGWSSRCPVHDDSENSLSLSEAQDGRVLIHCFAGCPPADVVAAVGLSLRDLFPAETSSSPRRIPMTVEDLARDKRLPADFLLSLGLSNRSDGVLIPYLLIDGSPARRQRLRTALKAKDGSRWLPGEGRPVPYGLDRIEHARAKGCIVLVEGESDCWTLWYHGFPALGVPGADMASKLEPEHLQGVDRVYVCREPDRGGETFVRGVARRLQEISG